MKLMKIEIENYKSITDRVCVRFCDGLPTVLIGKNGSGKSNILEALEHIISSNADYPGKYGSGGLRYCFGIWQRARAWKRWRSVSTAHRPPSVNNV